jgi:hypothetical protein
MVCAKQYHRLITVALAIARFAVILIQNKGI